MSGGMETGMTFKMNVSEFTRKVMKDFSVDEKTAERIIAFANIYALEKMKKWTFSMKKLQKEKADDIYKLTRRLKRGDKSVIDEIEEKILELCVET